MAMGAGVLERKRKQAAKVLDASLDDVETEEDEEEEDHQNEEEEEDHQDEEDAETNQQIENHTNLEEEDLDVTQVTNFSQCTIFTA